MTGSLLVVTRGFLLLGCVMLQKGDVLLAVEELDFVLFGQESDSDGYHDVISPGLALVSRLGLIELPFWILDKATETI